MSADANPTKPLSQGCEPAPRGCEQASPDDEQTFHERQHSRAVRWPVANLFRNPFGELTRAERAELAVVDSTPILETIYDSSAGEDGGSFRPFAAYQLIGECGRGKTTRMLALKKRFADASYVYLPEDQPCPSIPAGSPLLIDEAQRLPRHVRRRVFMAGSTLVLATHKDLARPLKKFGYTVVTERIGLGLTAERLVDILNRRINASRRDPRRSSPQIGLADAEELIRRFGTDIRQIESYLYDVVQSQENHHGQMRFID